MKSLFIIKIQSQSDVITNSSSELFIFNNKNSKDEVIELLDNIYPDWRDEYAEPVPFSEINENELWYLLPDSKYDIEDRFFQIVRDYTYINNINISREDFYNDPRCNELLESFNEKLKSTKYDLPEVKFARKYGLEPEVFWNGFNDLKVEIRSSYNNDWNYPSCPRLEISEEGIKAMIDANPNTWLLYSLDENPDWDHQEDLMEIATRIHLG